MTGVESPSEPSSSAAPRACVVVSYWVGRPRTDLFRLLAQITEVDAGTAFDLVVACNGGDERPLELPDRFGPLRPKILNRPNVGYNIGAWDAGWRESKSDYYLFLQDDCFLKRPGWLSEYVHRMSRDAGVGLLGESMEWDRMTWSFIREDTDRNLAKPPTAENGEHLIDFYRGELLRRGIPPGDVGSHLQTLVLFTSRKVLEEIDGFPTGRSFQEAIACEIGISRLIESRGYRVAQFAQMPFWLIGHRQWTRWNQMYMLQKRRVSEAVKRLVPGPVTRAVRRLKSR